jgi:predicted membrane-bound spermidine synthase
MFKLSPVRLILAIVLLEGFVTISAEILTIRQLIPFVGSSVVVTSVIIGVFLLFLAYGYRTGGRVQANHASILMRNFIAAAFLLGIGLSYIFVYFWFALWKVHLTPNVLYPLMSYLFIITAPLVYLLGQTVPLTLHLFPDAQAIKTGLLGGRILHVNTLGSFLGAVLTSVVLFSFFGVAWTIAINAGVLLLLAFLLFRKPQQLLTCFAATLLAVPFTFVLNIMVEQEYFLKTNHYANYRLSTYETPYYSSKQFEINNTPASFLDSQGKSFAYIETIKAILFNDLAMKNKDILILGAGGFTISHGQDEANRFVYIDIDSDIKSLSENHFSGPIVGEFIAQDARSFLQTTDRRFDAIVVDAYNSPLAIPQHLLTLEYFEALAKVLKPEGVVLLNFIANPGFTDAYARRVDNTLRLALGFCTNQPYDHRNKLTNLIYVCYPEHRDDRGIYSDNLNQATLDAFLMR